MTESSPVRMVDDPGIASAIREHLRCAIDHPPVGGAAPEAGLAALERSIAAGAPASATKIAGGLAIVGGAALAIWLGARNDATPPVVPPEVAPIAVVGKPSEVPEARVELRAHAPQAPPERAVVVETVEPVAEPVSPRGQPRERPATEVEPDSQREFRLLAAARKSVASAPERAWGLVQQSEREFPNGMMIEERDALAIEILVALERTDDARRRGDRFLAAHPKSPSANRVRELLARVGATP